MNTVLVLFAVASYFYGCGRLIRWASVRADREQPSWVDIIGMLLWPPMLARVVKWIIPNSKAWPETWIGAGVSLVTLFLVLVLWFKLRVFDAMLIWVLILVLATVMLLEILPHLPEKR